MALEHITDSGDLHWNCHNKACEPLSAHLKHDQVEWIEPGLVALPPCSGCGSRCFVKTSFTEQELTPPLIVRNPDGTIQSVEIRGAPNFTHIDYELHKHLVEDPEKPGEFLEAFSLTIKDVQPNPYVERHQKLHSLLHEHGKPAPISTPPDVEAALDKQMQRRLQREAQFALEDQAGFGDEILQNFGG